MLLYKIQNKLAFLLFSLIILNIVLIGKEIIIFQVHPDEDYYLESSDIYNKGGLTALIDRGDTKPISFLLLADVFMNKEKILVLNESYNDFHSFNSKYALSEVKYMRIFSASLVVLVTFLLYYISKNKQSFLFPVIPIIFTSMWFTVEIIEVFLLLLSFVFIKRQGVFVGLSCLFRPFSVIYFLLVKKDQIKYIIIIGILFSLFLLYVDGFFIYLYAVLGYREMTWGRVEAGSAFIDYTGIVLLLLFMFMGYSKNNIYFKWGLLSILPLFVRLPVAGHYFLTPVTFFFLSFLIRENVINAKCIYANKEKYTSSLLGD